MNQNAAAVFKNLLSANNRNSARRSRLQALDWTPLHNGSSAFPLSSNSFRRAMAAALQGRYEKQRGEAPEGPYARLDKKNPPKNNNSLKKIMKKLSFLAVIIAASGILSGCVSMQQQSSGFDASKVDPYVKVNTTKVDELRAILGTPTLSAVAVSDNARIYGWALSGHNSAASFGKNMFKSMTTLGFGSKVYDYTLKNIYVKADDHNDPRRKPLSLDMGRNARSSWLSHQYHALI